MYSGQKQRNVYVDVIADPIFKLVLDTLLFQHQDFTRDQTRKFASVASKISIIGVP